jgi:hypothetical protein
MGIGERIREGGCPVTSVLGEDGMDGWGYARTGKREEGLSGLVWRDDTARWDAAYKAHRRVCCMLSSRELA